MTKAHLLVAVVLFAVHLASAQSGNQENVTIDFVGDISFSGPVNHYIQNSMYTYEDTLRNMEPYLCASDIAMGNLESPILYPSDEKAEYHDKTETGTFLRAKQEAGQALKWAGFQVLNVANNHMNDFGEHSANTTWQVLNGLGLDVAGFTSGSRDRPQAPVIKTMKGVKIGILSYVHNITIYGCVHCGLGSNITSFRSGPAVLNNTNMAGRDIRRLKKIYKPDIIVVYLHFGAEYDSNPTAEQRDIVKNLTALGVNIIVGSHPHVLQKHCYHNNTLIAYSLGNFLFPAFLAKGNQEVFSSFNRSEDEKKWAMSRIPFYEAFYTHQNPSTISRLLRVEVNKQGVVGAMYLPLKIRLDLNTKVIAPTPVENEKWIEVCGDEDENCLSKNGACCF